MRAAGYYVMAGVLVAASVPMYWAIWHRSAGVVPLQPVSVTPREARALSSRIYTLDESSALLDLIHGRARCVSGVVYRTYDHVIAPWPGGIRCRAPVGVSDGPTVDVYTARVP